jgi:recombination protein RecT
MSNEMTPMVQMRQTLTNMNQEFKAALPAQIPVDRFIRTTITAVQMQPQLLECDRRSLLGATMKAAQDGLMPDGREAALVIFRTKEGPKVQYMPMVGGIMKKIRNSGELASIGAHVVYSNDLFEYELGDEERIVHKPMLGEDRGKPIAVYAIAKTKDGAIYREVMSVAEVNKVRAASRAKDSGPWVDWWDEMARKTVIRRIAKRLPSSADLEQTLENDNEASGFVQIQTAAAPAESAQVVEAAPKRASRLKAKMQEAVEHQPAETVDPVTGEVVDERQLDILNQEQANG